jgi:hypothetical protein
MKTVPAVSGLLFLAILLLPVTVQADDGQDVLSGYVSVAGKYDSNVDLLGEELPPDADPGDSIEDAYISEISAMMLLKSPWNSRWYTELELYGLSDVHVNALDDTWAIGRGNVYLGYSFGDNTLSFTNEGKYFTEPDDTEFDNYRNSATLAYRRNFSPLWQGRIGYENILHIYPDSEFFDYYANGVIVELRNTWLPGFSTYYNYGFQYYQGSYNSSTDDPRSSPEAGYRHTGEIGFESFFAKKNSLIGSYTFQVDDSSGQSIEQIGSFQGEDENLEVDAEFNFAKHKGTLLYSHRFNDRFTLSLYQEFIHKTFFERNKPRLFQAKERTDQLYLSSVWLRARLASELYAKARYLYRMNQSSTDYEDFQDHIFYLGMEYRF